MMKARSLIAPLAVVALGVGGLGYAQSHRPTTDAYVTAVAARGDVTSTLTTAGLVDRTGRHELRFDAPGTVTSVSVKVGDRVVKGQALAAIDPAPLRVQVLAAQAQLDAARAQLDADQRAQDAAKDASASPQPTALPSVALPPAALPSGGGATASGVAAGAAPTALTGAMDELRDAAQREQQVCGPLLSAAQRVGATPPALALPTGASSGPPAAPTRATASPSGEASPSAPSPSERDAAPSPSGAPRPTAPSAAELPTAAASQVAQAARSLQACSDALQELAHAQQQAGTALTDASQQLASANAQAREQLAQAQAQMTKTAQSAAQQAAAQAQASLAAQARAQLGGQVTDATLEADRARVLQAQQGLERAQANLDGATLVAPENATVGALTLVAAESSAGRSVTLVAPGAAEVSVQVPLSARPYVKPGTAAQVGLVGSPATLGGTVAEVSELPASASGTPSYTAKVRVDDPQLTLKPGASAAVTIALRSARDAVVVPPSALSMTSDTTGTVAVVADAHASSAQRVTVTTGAVGAQGVEIVAGLDAGQRVVLADRRLPVPGGLGQYQQARSGSTASPTPTR